MQRYNGQRPDMRQRFLQDFRLAEDIEGIYSSLSAGGDVCRPRYMARLATGVVGRTLSNDEGERALRLMSLFHMLERSYNAGRDFTKSADMCYRSSSIALAVFFPTVQAALDHIALIAERMPAGEVDLIKFVSRFKIANHPEWTVSLWRDLARHHLPTAQDANILDATVMRILPFANRLEALLVNREAVAQLIRQDVRANDPQALKADGTPKYRYIKAVANTRLNRIYRPNGAVDPAMPLYDLVLLAKQVCYQRAQENVTAAGLFFDCKIAEDSFDHYLSLTPRDSHQHIPNVRIQGGEIHPRFRGFYLQKLDPNDPKSAVLGKLSGCCQSMGDTGEDAAIHGIESPHGGFYVLYDARNRVLAQCWAWRADSGEIIFDSVEQNVDAERHHAAMVNDFFTYLACELVFRHGVVAVNVGVGGKTPKALGTEKPANQPPVGHDAKYSDAHLQRVIVDRSGCQLASYCERQAEATYLKPRYFWMNASEASPATVGAFAASSSAAVDAGIRQGFADAERLLSQGGACGVACDRLY